MLLMAVLGIAGVILLLVMLAGYKFGWKWTGVLESRHDEGVTPRKTVWDWTQLLAIPVILGAATIGFNDLLTERENARAETRAAVDRSIALDAQRQNLLEGYIDDMSALVLDRGLGTQAAGLEVKAVAKIRTLSTVAQLDGERKGRLVRFLWEAALIGGSRPVVSLSTADLSGAHLANVTMFSIDLADTDLTGADLRGANLDGGSLSGARVDDACLWGANLRLVSLRGASFRRSDLREASLDAASIDDQTVFEDANLADVRGTVDLAAFASFFRATVSSTNALGADERFWESHGTFFVESKFTPPLDKDFCGKSPVVPKRFVPPEKATPSP